MSWSNFFCLTLEDGHRASCRHLGVRLLGWWRTVCLWCGGLSGAVRPCVPSEGGTGVLVGPVACDHDACSPLTQSTTPHPKHDARIQTHRCTIPGQWPLAWSINTLLALIWAYNLMKSTCLKVAVQWRSWWPDSHTASGKWGMPINCSTTEHDFVIWSFPTFLFTCLPTLCRSQLPK